MRNKNHYLNKDEKGIHSSSKKHHRLRLLSFTMLFIFILSIVLFYFTELPFTGYAVKSFNSSEYIPFSGELDVPESILSKGTYELVSLEADNVFFRVEGEDFDMTNSRNNLMEFINFSGKLNFNSENVEVLEGKSPEVLVNGVELDEGNMDVDAIGIFDYSYLKIEGNFFIKKLDYVSSGILRFDETNEIDLRRDNVTIEEFIGNLEIKDKKMFLNGYVKSIEVDGNTKISVSK